MDLSWEKREIHAALQCGPGCTIGVVWREFSGPVDRITGAQTGDEEVVSGTLRAFQHQTEAKTELRRFAEVQAGDVFLDVGGDGLVTRYDGSTVALDSIAEKGVAFIVNGKEYAQARIGEELAEATLAKVGDEVLMRTLILRRSR